MMTMTVDELLDKWREANAKCWEISDRLFAQGYDKDQIFADPDYIKATDEARALFAQLQAARE